MLAGCLVVSGCREDSALVERTVDAAPVGTVTDQGIVLDENATPRQVAYVLLRALRDDVIATTRDERRAACKRELNLAAPDAILRISRRAYGAAPIERDETVRKAVDLWAPIVGAYVDSFDLDWESAAPRLVETSVRESSLGIGEVKSVLFEAADPGGDPNASVVVQIDLARENGYWRVYGVGFNTKRRHLGAARLPAGDPAGDGARA